MLQASINISFLIFSFIYNTFIIITIICLFSPVYWTIYITKKTCDLYLWENLRKPTKDSFMDTPLQWIFQFLCQNLINLAAWLQGIDSIILVRHFQIILYYNTQFLLTKSRNQSAHCPNTFSSFNTSVLDFTNSNI